VPTFAERTSLPHIPLKLPDINIIFASPSISRRVHHLPFRTQSPVTLDGYWSLFKKAQSLKNSCSTHCYIFECCIRRLMLLLPCVQSSGKTVCIRCSVGPHTTDRRQKHWLLTLNIQHGRLKQPNEL
jgi:hypothetical protein